jgi:hypothetical protein
MTHFSDRVRTGKVSDNPYMGVVGRGALMSPIQVYDIAPVVLDADGICAAQAVAAAGALTINGALASGGEVQLDVPRAVQVDSSDVGDTTQTITVTGYDRYGVPMSEDIALNGTTAVEGKKAFYRITGAESDAACTGNITVGTTDILGLPVRVDSRNYVLTAWNGAFVTTGTFAAAVTTDPATATTGDVRGTYTPPDAADGTKRLTAWIFVEDPDDLEGLYGVEQA